MRYYNKLETLNLDRDYLVKFLIKYPHSVAKGMLLNYLEFRDLPIKLPRISGRKKLKRIRKEILEPHEVEAITKAFLNYDVRFGLAFLITYYGGLRRSELLNIKLKDFFWSEWNSAQNQSNCKLLVTGKGNKQRIVLIPAKVMLILYYWITKFYPDTTANEFIFKISREKWRRKLNQFALNSIGKKVNPHLIRHSRTTHLYDLSEDLMFLRDFLGHESVATTQLYINNSKERNIHKMDRILHEEDSN